MATTTVTVDGFVRAPGAPVTDGNIAVFDTVTGELIADGGKTIAELTVDKSTGGNGAADAGKVLEFQAGGQIQGSAEDTGIPAVSGLSTGGDDGVYGGSVNGNGVYGESTNGSGVYGGSDTGEGVYGESTNGSGVYAKSANGNGVYGESANKEGVISQSNATAYAAIKAKNTNAANTAQLALFQNSDDDGLEVTNNGSLDWTLPLAKQQTRVNMLPALGGNAAKVLAVNGAADDVEWVAASGGGGGTWGSITGTLSDQTDLQAALDAKADKFPSVRTFTGTTDTLVIGDAGNTVNANCATACVITIPLNATVPFVARTRTEITWYGVGQPSIIPAGGATLNGGATAFKIAIRYGKCIIVREGTDEWTIDGNITT